MEPESWTEELANLEPEVEALAATILAGAKFDHTPHPVVSPKVIAICLLARSLSNFKAGVLLLQQNQIVESRILARCCLENLFIAAGLAESPDKFIEILEADDQASRKARGEFLLQIAKGPREDDGLLRASLAQLRKQSKTKNTPKEVARIGPVYGAYAYYSQLSADSAHPTKESLVGRYVKNKTHRDHVITVIEPMLQAEREEVNETRAYFSEALLGCCVFLGRFIVGPGIEELIRPVLNRYTALTKARTVVA